MERSLLLYITRNDFHIDKYNTTSSSISFHLLITVDSFHIIISSNVINSEKIGTLIAQILK